VYIFHFHLADVAFLDEAVRQRHHLIRVELVLMPDDVEQQLWLDVLLDAGHLRILVSLEPFFFVRVALFLGCFYIVLLINYPLNHTTEALNVFDVELGPLALRLYGCHLLLVSNPPHIRRRLRVLLCSLVHGRNLVTRGDPAGRS